MYFTQKHGPSDAGELVGQGSNIDAVGFVSAAVGTNVLGLAADGRGGPWPATRAPVLGGTAGLDDKRNGWVLGAVAMELFAVETFTV